MRPVPQDWGRCGRQIGGRWKSLICNSYKCLAKQLMRDPDIGLLIFRLSRFARGLLAALSK
jgi:hypothetical protein